jgi:hypothetical protein
MASDEVVNVQTQRHGCPGFAELTDSNVAQVRIRVPKVSCSYRSPNVLQLPEQRS